MELSQGYKTVAAFIIALPLFVWRFKNSSGPNSRLEGFFFYCLSIASVSWLYAVSVLVPEPYLVRLILYRTHCTDANLS